MPLYPPTPKQQEVLDYIVQHLEKRHCSPTVAEMAAHFGLNTNSIQTRLRGLERRGWLKKPGLGNRGYLLLGATVTVKLPKCKADEIERMPRQ